MDRAGRPRRADIGTGAKGRKRGGEGQESARLPARRNLDLIADMWCVAVTRRADEPAGNVIDAPSPRLSRQKRAATSSSDTALRESRNRRQGEHRRYRAADAAAIHRSVAARETSALKVPSRAVSAASASAAARDWRAERRRGLSGASLRSAGRSPSQSDQAQTGAPPKPSALERRLPAVRSRDCRARRRSGGEGVARLATDASQGSAASSFRSPSCHRHSKPMPLEEPDGRIDPRPAAKASSRFGRRNRRLPPRRAAGERRRCGAGRDRRWRAPSNACGMLGP